VTIESGSQFAGEPDGLERLWTPHRMVYLDKADGRTRCPFCVSPERTEDEALIVHRGKHAFVILNLYPYNSGHLMVCPYRHVATYDEATADEVAEIGSLTQTAMRVLTVATGCAGFNIGMNQGEVAGAGIQEHLHQHIVPRWSNDSNFFPIIAKTKAMPVLLGEMRERLAQHWPNES
jgi:ATP adenylyltransferase